MQLVITLTRTNKIRTRPTMHPIPQYLKENFSADVESSFEIVIQILTQFAFGKNAMRSALIKLCDNLLKMWMM